MGHLGRYHLHPLSSAPLPFDAIAASNNYQAQLETMPGTLELLSNLNRNDYLSGSGGFSSDIQYSHFVPAPAAHDTSRPSQSVLSGKRSIIESGLPCLYPLRP